MIKVTVKNQPKINVDMKKSPAADIGIRSSTTVINTAPTYNGSYSVKPKAFEDITLPTANKLMKNNVTIEKVPYFETSNETGTTIYIADSIGGI